LAEKMPAFKSGAHIAFAIDRRDYAHLRQLIDVSNGL
jgi:hypothetical protein